MKNHYLKYLILILLIGNYLIVFSQQIKKNNPVDSLKYNLTTMAGYGAKQASNVFDSTEIITFFNNYPAIKTYANQVWAFYKKLNYAYVWFDNGLLIAQANQLSGRMINLKSDGVYKEIAYQKALDSLLSTYHKTDTKRPEVKLELMLTAQYFVFSKLAWEGMNTTESKATKWYLPRKKVNYDQYLDSIIKVPAKQFPANEPVYRQYELLRKHLARYRELNTKDKWLPIIINKNYPKLGDSSLIILQVKNHLFKLEDYNGDTLNNVFDEGLIAALKHFQDRHGLTMDGLIDKKTIAEINVPIETRIKQILVNMERSRWLPVTVNADYLAVNIPEFKLHVYNNDSLLWSCNVVVGQTVHQTVVFYGEVQSVVFSPYWNVPSGILRKEVVPGMKRNRNYIASHNMEVTGYNGGLPVVRQKPGPRNALGLVKFLFPNSYDIYLHDTPTKSLFGESTRAFSHGCIRIKEPEKLANFLLQNDKAWDADKINAAMHLGKEKWVTLGNKVPVFIAYFTAFTDRNDVLNFRKDIYKLDDNLADKIISGKGLY